MVWLRRVKLLSEVTSEDVKKYLVDVMYYPPDDALTAVFN